MKNATVYLIGHHHNFDVKEKERDEEALPQSHEWGRMANLLGWHLLSEEDLILPLSSDKFGCDGDRLKQWEAVYRAALRGMRSMGDSFIWKISLGVQKNGEVATHIVRGVRVWGQLCHASTGTGVLLFSHDSLGNSFRNILEWPEQDEDSDRGRELKHWSSEGNWRELFRNRLDRRIKDARTRALRLREEARALDVDVKLLTDAYHRIPSA